MTDYFDLFPQFRAGENRETYDCRENCFLKYYPDADPTEVSEWLGKLIAEGFTVLQKRQPSGNTFAQLRGKGLLVTLLYTPCDGSVRITAAKDGSTPAFEPADCRENGETVFYCFESDQTMIDCGMCLIIQCADGSFFLVDSGHYLQVNDNDRIHRFLRERTPEGKKIVISGWLITHGHTDHISKLIDFLLYNCDDVEIEGFYSNLLSNDYDPERWGREETLLPGKLFRLLEKHPAPKYKLHTGQRFYVRNLCFDVLGTQEDIYPERITDYNDSSCIVMLTVNGSKVFIPGDAAALASKKLEARFGKDLKCDVVQVSHHGHRGLSKTAYELLDGDCVVFPITRIKFDEEYPRIEANRRAIELAKEYYISSDGTVEIPLPYRFGSVRRLPDETFEDFEKIRRLWGYDYTDERKQELFDLFIRNGGDLDKIALPVDGLGYIELGAYKKIPEII